jgi:hypothetical protein
MQWARNTYSCDLEGIEMGQLVQFEEMSLEAIEVACQSAFEECESVFRAIESKGKQLEIFGRLLTAAKSKVAHGEWENWLTDTFAGRLKLRTAQLWMSKAQKVALLESSESEPIVPRSERKTGRVAVEKPGQTAVQPDHSADVNKMVDENAVTPAPKTNTKHTPATAKAKEADRAVPMAVTPVIVEEPETTPEAKTLSDWSVDEILTFLKESADNRKKRAKEMRKAADELDPPAVGAPSIEAVQDWASSEGIPDFDAEKFFNHYSLAGWKYGKAKTPIKDWRRAAINAYSGGKGWAVDGANRLPF